jgi:hypothetical protein
MPPITTTTFRYTGHPGESITVCDSDKLNITCQNGEQILIISAYYGRNNKNTCGESDWEISDCDYDASDYIRARLSHFSSISVDISPDFFDYNPCYGIKKYTIIEYTCTRAEDFTHYIPDCKQWMKNANFVDLNQNNENYCNCSVDSQQKMVNWKNLDQCSPVTTTVYLYEAWITGAMSINYTEPFVIAVLNEKIGNIIINIYCFTQLLERNCKLRKFIPYM